MPWLLDPITRTDDIIRAAQDLIVGGGVAAVTYRAIGRSLRLSASTLHDHYPERAYLLTLVADSVAKQREDQCYDAGWCAWAERGQRPAGVPTWVPAEDDELRTAVVWQALCDLARTEARLTPVVDEAGVRERQYLRRALAARRALTTRTTGVTRDVWSHQQGQDLTDAHVEIVQALVHGLTLARVTGSEPMTHARAVELLELVVTDLVGGAAENAD